MYFFQLIPRSWLQSQPDTSMMSLGNFDKTVLLLKEVISEIFWDQLLGFPRSLCVDFWPMVASPGPWISPIFARCCWKCQHTYRAAAEQKSQKFHFCGFEGISKLSSDRPQRFRDLCQWVWISPRHWGVSSFVWVKLVMDLLYSKNVELPWLLFHLENEIFWRLRGFYSPKENKKLKSN